MKLYYNSISGRVENGESLSRRGLDSGDSALMRRFGIFPLEIEAPGHDSRKEALEPEGKPEPRADDPGVYVQRMRVFDALGRHKEWMMEEAARKRREHEAGGLALPDGTRILTAIEDQNRVSAALVGMRNSGIAEVDFKAASGWVRLDQERLAQMAALIASHVQACFSNERALHEAIGAAQSLDELNLIDLEGGWPRGDSGD